MRWKMHLLTMSMEQEKQHCDEPDWSTRKLEEKKGD